MYLFLRITLLSFLLGSCMQSDKEISEPSESEAIMVGEVGNYMASKLLVTLSSELSAAIKREGLVEATRFCNIRALPLTEMLTIASQYPVEVKRTSFKYRNPLNEPDKYEKVALKYYEKFAHDGKELPPEFIQKINLEDESYFYFYRPLIMNGLCIQCHGNQGNMNTELVSVLHDKYPEDKALNYKEGDFRGLIRVKVELNE
ncbi:MAG: DUF3365 domain-containing protein [Bacteroidales bacterium]|nr:DUF3365 domain-containing protein [Bacteroidales bacterium]